MRVDLGFMAARPAPSAPPPDFLATAGIDSKPSKQAVYPIDGWMHGGSSALTTHP